MCGCENVIGLEVKVDGSKVGSKDIIGVEVGGEDIICAEVGGEDIIGT